MKIGVYPGRFDPFTIGHLDVLKSAAQLFDVVYVAVLNLSQQRSVFTTKERMEMIDRLIQVENIPNARAAAFDGLLIDYAQSVGATHLIRGLRGVMDFEHAFQLDAINGHLSAQIKTVYFMANPEQLFLSSSHVNEAGRYGGTVEGLVPSCNLRFVQERLAGQDPKPNSVDTK